MSFGSLNLHLNTQVTLTFICQLCVDVKVRDQMILSHKFRDSNIKLRVWDSTVRNLNIKKLRVKGRGDTDI